VITFRHLITLAAAMVALGASRQTAVTYDVYAVQCGVIKNFRMSQLIAGGDPAGRVDMSLMVWLLKGTNGQAVLVDTGFHRADVVDRLKPVDFVTASEALRRFGAAPEAVTDIIVTHVHFDHVGGVDLFPNARVWIQRDEYEHYVDESGRARTPAIHDADAAMLAGVKRAGRIVLVDGDAREILPGVTVYTGGKHTFASQYVGVRAGDGVVVLASDDMHLYESLERHVPIAQTLDAASNLHAQDRMKTIASNPRLIVPGHDPAVFARFPLVAQGVARIR
jgi:glyoxylase-like metal-dependent hydrolase (beta-lactamase superfamily II)